MRIIRLNHALAILFLLVVFGFEYDDMGPRTLYKPILMNRSELETSIKIMPPDSLFTPGKIYVYRSWLLLVDVYRGVHIINNTNPKNPVKEYFIQVPGVIDMAIRKNILFVDNAIDLVGISLDNLPSLLITDREKNVFPELTPPDLDYIPFEFSSHNRPDNTVIVRWE